MDRLERIAGRLVAMSQQYIADREGHVYTDFTGLVEYGGNNGRVEHATLKLENGVVRYNCSEGGSIVRMTGNWQEDLSLSGNAGRKYELSDIGYGRWSSCWRIRALRDIGVDVKAGMLGGWVESEENLSQDGDCWIYGISMVKGSSRISGDAQVLGTSVVEDSTVSGKCAIIDSEVSGSELGGTTIVTRSTVKSGVKSDGTLVQIKDGSYLCGSVTLGGSAEVSHSTVNGHVAIDGNAKVEDCEIASVGESPIHIGGEAQCKGSYISAEDVAIEGKARVVDDIRDDGTRLAGIATRIALKMSPSEELDRIDGMNFSQLIDEIKRNKSNYTSMGKSTKVRKFEDRIDTRKPARGMTVIEMLRNVAKMGVPEEEEEEEQ